MYPAQGNPLWALCELNHIFLKVQRQNSLRMLQGKVQLLNQGKYV